MDNYQFATIILGLCLKHHGSITSWIRTVKRNSQVGGKPHSKHLTGRAVDIVLDDHKRAKTLIAEAKINGLQAFDEATHIHVQIPTPP